MISKIIISLSLTVALFAQSAEDDLLQALENDFAKYSKIATDTKQNVDYMPYVVSVLKNEEMTKLGILSLREALSLIPGVDIAIGMAGVQNPIFRGSNPYAMGQSKLIIDGQVVNDQMFGAYYQYLDMPIDLIQRIEVVRGPGSLQSDVNAYSGSIHVITKANRDDGNKKENSIFAAYGSDKFMMGGFVGSYKDEDFELSSDFAYQEHDKHIPAGPDRFGQSLDAQQWIENYALGLNLSFKDLYIKGRLNKNDTGVSYGQAFSLSDDTSDYLNIQNNSLEIGYKFSLGNDIEAKLSVGYYDETRNLQNKVMPDGSMMMMPNGMMMPLPNGMYFLVDYKEKTYNEKLEFKISTFEDHTITAGIKLSQSSIKQDIARNSRDDLVSFFRTSDLLSNSKRDHSSFYIDDLFNINEKTSVQVGLKYDKYNDIKNQLSPRLAVVHRYDDKNIYKLMYTHSYREPSWREQYLVGTHYFSATTDMKPESVDAYEAAYIRKINSDSDLKLNIYYLVNKDQINAQNTARTFMNSGNNKLYGFEAEFRTKFTKKDTFYINYSRVDGANVDETLADSAQNMIKTYYMYDLNSNTNISTILKYVGNKDRIKSDARDKTNEYITTDISLGYTYEPYDLSINASLKNVFDEKYYLPAPKGTYSEDLPQEGRNFLVRLSKRF